MTVNDKSTIVKYCGYDGKSPSGFASWQVYYKNLRNLHNKLDALTSEETDLVKSIVTKLNTFAMMIKRISKCISEDPSSEKTFEEELEDLTNVFNKSRHHLCIILNISPGPDLVIRNSFIVHFSHHECSYSRQDVSYFNIKHKTS